MATFNFIGFQSLLENGVCVFPLCTSSTIATKLRQSFDKSLQQQHELYGPDGNSLHPPYVGGGFAAFGHASSFHDSIVRDIRTRAFRLLVSALKSGEVPVPANLSNIEMIPDRQSFRPKGAVPPAEAWHRDLSPVAFGKTNPYVKALPGDLIFGGWVNCNENESHTFICVPRSHVAGSMGSGDTTGFQSLTKEEIEQCKQQQVSVEIPPGHGMYFIQDIIHCVNAKKLNFDMRRIFIAARLTQACVTQPLITDIEERLVRGDVVPLKSGQIPRMYPQLWLVSWQDKLIHFSEKFSDEMKETRMLRGKRLRDNENTPPEGEYRVLKRIAPSFPPKVPYSQEEISLHLPHSIH